MRVDMSDEARAARAIEADRIRAERFRSPAPDKPAPVAVKPARISRPGRSGARPGAGRPRGSRDDMSPDAVAARAARRAKLGKPPGPGRGGARPGAGRKPGPTPATLEKRARQAALLDAMALALLDDARRKFQRATELRASTYQPMPPDAPTAPQRGTVTGATATG